VHLLELPLAYASMQSYPEALAGQEIVNVWPVRGLAGFTIGVPNPQELQVGEETLNDMVKSLVLAFPEASMHLT
jgi:hypothetical protein